MIHGKPPKLFFAGTDTDVGKTYVASLAARVIHGQGTRLGVYKPVASGCIEKQGKLIAEDAVSLWQAAGEPLTLEHVCPQRFRAPLAPPEAAEQEQKQVDTKLLTEGVKAWEDFDMVIVEGAGGLFSPLADGILNIDLIQQLQATTVLVAANRLGVIHQTLSTCEAAAKRGVHVRGIILCDPTGDADESTHSNSKQIAKYCPVPILGTIPFRGESEDAAFLQSLIPPIANPNADT